MKPEKFAFNFQSKTAAEQSAATPTERKNLLESTRLSHLPKLPDRPKFELPNFTPATSAPACVGCSGRLDREDTLQQSVRGCRKCLGVYARLDLSMDEADKRKRRDRLEKFAEVK